MKPDITIFADASHDVKTGAAGWAAWIKADGVEPIHCSAGFKDPMASSTLAECCAVANALVVAKLRGLLAPGRHVMVQSDCLAALHILITASPDTMDRPAVGGLAAKDGLPQNGKLPKFMRRKEYAPVQKMVKAIIAETGITVQTRHVGGHKKGDGRQWVNRSVDKAARHEMRKRRQTSRAPVTAP